MDDLLEFWCFNFWCGIGCRGFRLWNPAKRNIRARWKTFPGALSCGSLLMQVLWIFAVLIAETRRRIVGDRRAMAEPRSVE